MTINKTKNPSPTWNWVGSRTLWPWLSVHGAVVIAISTWPIQTGVGVYGGMYVHPVGVLLCP